MIHLGLEEFLYGLLNRFLLARQQFGALQHRIFPVYFNLSIVLAGGLLTLWTRSHPAVVQHVKNPLVADVAQAYTLAAIVFLQGSNRFIVGPLTSKYVQIQTNASLVLTCRFQDHVPAS